MKVPDKVSKGLPEYEKPPLIEVVCGISFKYLDRLLAPHFGLLWEQFKQNYPNCREVAPLMLQVEGFGPLTHVEAQLLDVPPLPRIWFVDAKGNKTIQLQRERFLHNWKKVEPSDEYPRYPAVSNMFFDRLSDFRAFLSGNNLGTIEPLQYELSYVNHIPKGEGWETLRDIGKVFPDFAWDFGRKRLAPDPESLNWKATFQLPEQSGRLHAAVRSANRVPDNTPLLLFEQTVRGIGKDRSLEAMVSWFHTAHAWVVQTFADLTSEELQKNVWGRKS